MLVLSASEAAAVVGVSAPGSELFPIPLPDGRYILPERVLRDPEHASKLAQLSLLPFRTMQWAEMPDPSVGSGEVEEIAIDGLPEPLKYFAADGCSWPLYLGATTPPVVYVPETDTTWFSWEAWTGSVRVVKWRTYNHTIQQWSPAYTCGTATLVDDDHGVPSLCRDAGGYMHIFYGAHATNMQHSVSAAPDDPSGYTAQSAISGTYTYPHCTLVGSTLYLFMRKTRAQDQPGILRRSASVTNGVVVWEAEKEVINLDTDSRYYSGYHRLRGTDIHIVFTRANYGDTYRRNIYYVIYDTVAGSLSNYGKTFTVAAESLPISLTDLDTNCRLIQTSAIRITDMPSLDFDSGGNPHLIIQDGGGAGNATIKHFYHDGSGWTVPVDIGTSADRYQTPGVICYPDGRVGCYFIEDTLNVWARGGDLRYRERNAEGVWGTARTVHLAGTFALDGSFILYRRPAGLQVIFQEVSGDATVEQQLRVFAYGENGYLTI